MRPPEIIETARLRLRQPTLEDAPALFERYTQDPDVTRYLTWRPHTNVSQTEAFVQRCLAVWAEGEAFPWVLEGRGETLPIGMVELRIRRHMADLGYVLARPYWGQGYMTEAARAVVEWALGQSSIFRVWAVCDVENAASVRLLEKIGMRREGILRRWLIHSNISEDPRDCYSYSITK